MLAYYVYRLVDPRSGKTFYIGKGIARRIDQHEREARRGVRSLKCNTIKEILAAGLQVIKLKVGLFSRECDAYAFEAALIEEERSSLTNGGKVEEADAPIEPKLCRALAILLRMKRGVLEPIDDPARPWGSAVSRAAFRSKDELIAGFFALYPLDKWRVGLARFGVELVHGG